jgi:hypothetical protein
MSSDMGDVQGTRIRPWKLSTPDGSPFTAYRDPESNPPALVVRSGAVELRFHLRCLNDLHEMLKEKGDWMPLGAAEEGQPAGAGTVEAWARSPGNPVAGWYGLTASRRGGFASYIPPIMVALDLAEIESARRRLRMRAT